MNGRENGPSSTITPHKLRPISHHPFNGWLELFWLILFAMGLAHY